MLECDQLEIEEIGQQTHKRKKRRRRRKFYCKKVTIIYIVSFIGISDSVNAGLEIFK